MNKKSMIIAILLLFIVVLSSNSVFAEEINDNTLLQQDDNIANTIQEDQSTSPKTETVTVGSNSSTIQNQINSLSDGDTLNFEKGEYKNISIYVDKSITINGNGAVLIGYDTPSNKTIPKIIATSVPDGGYGLTNYATLYIVNTNGVTLNGLTFIGGQNSASILPSALVYASKASQLNIYNNTFDGACTGIYLNICHDGTLYNNTVKNQGSTGILNFASARTLIKENTVINAVNHGIDARHGTGPDVQVINNTVIGSKEGIYLMHSKGHVAADNTIVNCTLSSITCYGSGNIRLTNNKLQYSRIGILLACGYSNITIEENDYQLYRIPLPPIFTYYVAEAKSDYQSAEFIMGTYTDITQEGTFYTDTHEIPTPSEKVIDYDTLLTPTGEIKDIPDGATSAEIQAILNSLNDGDAIKFAQNGHYYNISIYTTKNIKIIGNNATLYGLEKANMSDMPADIKSLGVIYLAVIYSANNTNVAISDLNIISRYPDHNLKLATTPTDEYKTAGIYATKSENILITNCKIDGASFGIMLHFMTTGGCANAIVTNNYITNQWTYGILNFGSKASYIANNTVVNAKFHGIDVRHGQGPNVIVYNNTVIGSMEGIYLMHSHGHKVYNNIIKDSTVSSISVYGTAGKKVDDIYLFNNTLENSRVGILVGGGNQNVTIGENIYKLDAQKSGDKPGFGIYLLQSSDAYSDAENVAGTYFEKTPVTITVEDLTTTPNTGTLNIKLTDFNGKAVKNKMVSIQIGNDIINATTSDDGTIIMPLNLAVGEYNVEVNSLSDALYDESSATAKITVKEAQTSSSSTQTSSAPAKVNKKATKITAKKKTFKAKVKVKKYTITLKSGKNPVKKVWVTLKIKGKKVIKAKTNAKGKATFKIKTLKKKGKYTATIKFAGNKNFKAISKKVTITVKK